MGRNRVGEPQAFPHPSTRFLPHGPGRSALRERPCKDPFPGSLASTPLGRLRVGPEGPACNQGLCPVTSPLRSPHHPGN